MSSIALIAAALLSPTPPAGFAPAPAKAHQQHQATGQQRAEAAPDARCCCEEMMHKMMMDMMQKHQGASMSQSGDRKAPPPGENHKH